jgi:antitoxin component of MazEF toxin-antitoxin module
MVNQQAPKTITARLVRVGQNVALVLPERAMRTCGFLAGGTARVVLLNDEFRVRRIPSPRLYDLESLDDYRERRALEELERDDDEDDT